MTTVSFDAVVFHVNNYVVTRILIYGFKSVEGVGVFRVPKKGDTRNKKPPAMNRPPNR